MKTFETVLKHLKSIGFEENQHNKVGISKRQWLLSLILFLDIVLTFIDLYYVVDTTEDYMNGILVLTIAILIFIAYLSTAFKTATIFIFINQYDKIINESE